MHKMATFEKSLKHWEELMAKGSVTCCVLVACLLLAHCLLGACSLPA